MKTNYYVAVSIVVLLSLQGCSDFLEIKPKSQGIAVDNNNVDAALYTKASDVEAALSGLYGGFRNEYYELDYFVNGDVQSDDAYAGGDNPNNFQQDNFKIDATNSNVSRDWGYLYSMIANANLIINNIDAVTDPALTTERKRQIIGEASFIRAFCYFQAVQLWGDVPLLLKGVKTISAELLPEIYPLLFPPRVASSEVYKQIIIDLETAAQNVAATAAHKGFVTKGAANAMLAKVYAAQDPHDWAKVKQYSDLVIAGGYSLLPSFEQLWDNSNENSAESIFEINYFGGTIDGNWGVSIFRGLDWKKFNTPSNDLIAAFDSENDAVRKASTFTFIDVSGKWSDNNWPLVTYPFENKYRKYLSPSDQNYIFIRLADIILLKAEALNELGDTPGAAALVNQIRTRVSLPNTTASSQSTMRLAIEKERRLELALEGHRWYDLKRTGRAIEIMNSVKGKNNTSLGYILTTNRLFWPIPQSELDKNSKLVQNPGY